MQFADALLVTCHGRKESRMVSKLLDSASGMMVMPSLRQD